MIISLYILCFNSEKAFNVTCFIPLSEDTISEIIILELSKSDIAQYVQPAGH